MKRKLTAGDRLERMLTIVPYVAARPEGVAIDELCSRFDLDRPELLSCLDTVFMVGVHPYTPDALIDVIIDSDTVVIRMSDWFRRPVQLNHQQRFALLIARRAFLSVPGAETDGPLMRALDKIARAIEASPVPLIMEFDAGDDSDLERLRGAIDERRVVEFRYYNLGRNSLDVRVVEPWRLQIDSGHWYLEGRCLEADDRRVFRVDRIESVLSRNDTFDPPIDLPPFEAFPTSEIARTITLDLAPAGRWVATQYPSISAEEGDDGVTRIVLPVASTVWLERLLLRLGPDATIVDADDDLGAVGVAAARRLRSRYDN